MWQRNDADIPLEKIKEILGSSSVKNTLISLVPTGGEPTLHEDLPEIFEYAFENLRSLRSACFFTNSLLPHKVREVVKKTMDLKARQEGCFLFSRAFFGRLREDTRRNNRN
jgi:MoaA/NifB/PqqE/SkfB family radical SAM enzyme